ncbi:MAG: methionyl-tRNA formyltransferase [Clostridiales bacterium]|jgi:methionyl-tRNA formyltransferase|nr:methionyl-tRNA formyltransferase [Clostridiales bacterium]
MNVIFMGTPEFSEVILKSLIGRHNVRAVVTQPDKPAGRGHKTQPPPVKRLARGMNIPVFQPEKLRDQAFIDTIKSYCPDVIVVAAYGKILPKSLLETPPLGCINVHASLLPKYRGAAPIQWAIINGEIETGVTIMRMDEGVDTGGMILKTPTSVTPDETFGTLRGRLAEMGAAALLEALELEEVVIEEQDGGEACYAPMITNETCLIDWNKSSFRIINLIRALNPEPGAVTSFEGMKIWRAELFNPDPSHKNALPGEIIDIGKRGLAVKTVDGAVIITELQAKGGKKMPAADYLRGHSIPLGIKI